jgi:hypothetical protein
VFVESVLRYGLPPDFTSVTIIVSVLFFLLWKTIIMQTLISL